MFTMYELQKDEVQTELDFDKQQEGERWWSFEPLTYLDLSSNSIQQIPGRIKMFEDLNTLNVSLAFLYVKTLKVNGFFSCNTIL